MRIAYRAFYAIGLLAIEVALILLIANEPTEAINLDALLGFGLMHVAVGVVFQMAPTD